MKRVINSIVLLFLCGILHSQIYTPVYPTTYGNNFLRVKALDVLHVPDASDSTLKTTDNSSQIRFINGILYSYTPSLGYWSSIGYTSNPSYDYINLKPVTVIPSPLYGNTIYDSIGFNIKNSSGIVVNLSKSLLTSNRKYNFPDRSGVFILDSDTSGMLSPFLHKLDTTGRWLGIGWQSTLNGKVNKADSNINGGYYPYSTNPKGYITTAVTSIATGWGATGGTITTTGTINADSSVICPRADSNKLVGYVTPYNLITNYGRLGVANTWTGANTFNGGFATNGAITAAAWGVQGINFNLIGQTFTDNTSTATVSNNYVNTIGAPILTATHTGVTYTNTASLYIAGPPTASSAGGFTPTLTSPYTFNANGKGYFNGALTVNTGGLTVNAGGVSSNGNVYISAGGQFLYGGTSVGNGFGFNGGSAIGMYYNTSTSIYIGSGTSALNVNTSNNIGIGAASTNTNKLEVTGDESITGSLKMTSTQTTINGATSGSAVFSEPFQGSSYKKVIIYCNALLGATTSYTFPTAFSFTPAIVSTNGLSSSIVTTLTTSGMIVTGATSTGFLILEGY